MKNIILTITCTLITFITLSQEKKETTKLRYNEYLKDTSLLFDSATIYEILNIANRNKRYNIQFNTKQPITETLYGSMPLSENLPDIIDGLCYHTNICYEIKGNNITIMDCPDTLSQRLYPNEGYGYDETSENFINYVQNKPLYVVIDKAAIMGSYHVKYVHDIPLQLVNVTHRVKDYQDINNVMTSLSKKYNFTFKPVPNTNILLVDYKKGKEKKEKYKGHPFKLASDKTLNKQILYFKNIEVYKLIDKLATLYNLSVQYKVEKSSDKKINGKIVIDGNIKETLNALLFTDINTFEINGKTIIIKERTYTPIEQQNEEEEETEEETTARAHTNVCPFQYIYAFHQL